MVLSSCLALSACMHAWSAGVLPRCLIDGALWEESVGGWLIWRGMEQVEIYSANNKVLCHILIKISDSLVFKFEEKNYLFHLNLFPFCYPQSSSNFKLSLI